MQQVLILDILGDGVRTPEVCIFFFFFFDIAKTRCSVHCVATFLVSRGLALTAQDAFGIQSILDKIVLLAQGFIDVCSGLRLVFCDSLGCLLTQRFRD